MIEVRGYLRPDLSALAQRLLENGEEPRDRGLPSSAHGLFVPGETSQLPRLKFDIRSEPPRDVVCRSEHTINLTDAAPPPTWGAVAVTTCIRLRHRVSGMNLDGIISVTCARPLICSTYYPTAQEVK